MRTPEVVSIEVVLDDGKKMFRLPDGSLAFDILAGTYGSWKPYKEGEEIVGFEKEVDTPFVVFRKGECFDRGVCEYIFGSDGYHVVEGISLINKGRDHRAFMYAKWFEPGDVISFIRTPSAYELQQRRLKSGKEALGD
jgi:hypothetical protein